MSRPTSPDELDDYERQGHRVANIDSSYITRYPSLGMHLLAALAEAAHLGLEVKEDGEIIIPLTEEELTRKVESAQRSWDYGKKQHEEYLESGEWPTYSYLWNNYLTAEGIEAPKKPEAQS